MKKRPVEELGPFGRSFARALQDEDFIARQRKLREEWAAWVGRASEGSNEQNPEVVETIRRLRSGEHGWLTYDVSADAVLSAFATYLDHYGEEGAWSHMNADERETRAQLFLQFVIGRLGFAHDAPTMVRFLERHLESFRRDMR